MVTKRINASTIGDAGCRNRALRELGAPRMKRHFSGGGRSSAPAVVPPPKEEDPAVQQAAAEAARRRKLGRGYRSTVLGSMYQSGMAAGGGTGQPGQGSTFGT